MYLKEETIKEVCRYVIIPSKNDNIRRLIEEGLNPIVNPNVPSNTAEILIIDMYEGKFTYGMKHDKVISDPSLLNDIYIGESLETLVTIPQDR
jgi:hypothetical protein